MKTRPYNCIDTEQTWYLGRDYLTPDALLGIPYAQELIDLQADLEEIADEMTWRGMRVSPERQAYHHHQLRTRQRLAEIKFQETAKSYPKSLLANKGAGPGFSPIALKEYFFQHLGVEPLSFSDETGEPSLDEETLTELRKHESQQVRDSARYLLKARKWKHLDKQFITKLEVDENHVCHPFHMPCGTISGRWAGKRPNPYNIPNPQEEMVNGKVRVIHGGLRDIFIPVVSGNWFVGADYSQIELKLAAYLAGESGLIAAFESGKDVHHQTALYLFHKGNPKGEVSSRQRTCTKNASYNLIYGGGASAMLDAVIAKFPDFTLGACVEFLERYNRKFPAFGKWHKSLQDTAEARWELTDHTLSHRTRRWYNHPPLPEVYNLLPQCGASHVINQAIKPIFRALRWPKEGITLQLHDALYIEGPDPYRLGKLLKENMEVVVRLNGRDCLLTVDLAVGKDLGNMKKVKDLNELRRLR